MSLALTRTRLAVVAIVLAFAASVGLAAVNASPANAQGYWAQKCGPGFSLFWKVPLRPTGKYGHVRVFQRHSGHNTDWCAITVRHRAAKGNRSWTAIKIGRGDGGNWKDVDRGHFKYWAGPVHVWNSIDADFYGRLHFRGTKEWAHGLVQDY